MNGHYILICEDSETGILTGIYEAYERKLDHASTILQVGEEENLRLFAEYIRIIPSQEKSDKVIRTIRRKFGTETLRIILEALASCDNSKGQAVYQMIVFGLKGEYKGQLIDCLSQESVIKTVVLSTTVWREIHHFYGFLRFQELASGILYAKIKPKAKLITFLGDHFADRFPLENFMIYDEEHDYWLMHEAKKDWFTVAGELVQTDGLLTFSEDEQMIQELFCHFVNKIAIKERENLALQQQMLPLRFRSNMIEV